MTTQSGNKLLTKAVMELCMAIMSLRHLDPVLKTKNTEAAAKDLEENLASVCAKLNLPIDVAWGLAAQSITQSAIDMLPKTAAPVTHAAPSNLQ